MVTATSSQVWWSQQRPKKPSRARNWRPYLRSGSLSHACFISGRTCWILKIILDMTLGVSECREPLKCHHKSQFQNQLFDVKNRGFLSPQLGVESSPAATAEQRPWGGGRWWGPSECSLPPAPETRTAVSTAGGHGEPSEPAGLLSHHVLTLEDKWSCPGSSTLQR